MTAARRLCTLLLACAGPALAQGDEGWATPPPPGLSELTYRAESAATPHAPGPGEMVIVSTEQPEISLFSCYYSLEAAGVPIYVTADAMLHLWASVYRQAVAVVERQAPERRASLALPELAPGGSIAGYALSGLAVGAALGSDLSAQPEAAVRNALPTEGVPGAWVATLRALFQQPEGLPPFARTEAYRAKQLNCCLASWLQMNAAGAAGQDSWGEGTARGGCSGLVEPLPGFFSSYTRMCGELADLLMQCGIGGPPLRSLQLLQEKAEVFRRCAEDELAGRDTSWAAIDVGRFGSLIDHLCLDSPVAVVTMGAGGGRALSIGSGGFRRILVGYEQDGKPAVAQGWVGSYYELAEPAPPHEQWEKLLQSTYAQPQPPSWLAALSARPEEAEAPQSAELARIERDLVAGNWEAGIQAADALISRGRETLWAPQAVLLVGKYLADAGRDAEAMEYLERARPLRGCDARDEALDLQEMRRQALQSEERREPQRRVLQEALAATEPVAGLSAEDDVQRQDRRAKALLEAVISAPRRGPESRGLLDEVLLQCPQSGYVPYAELLVALPDWLPPSPVEAEALSREALAPRRDALQVVAHRYSGSAVGRAARFAIVGIRLTERDYETAYSEANDLLAQADPDPEPYPLSAGMLGRWWSSLPMDDHSLRPALVRALLPRACLDGDVRRVRELVGPAEQDRMLSGSDEVSGAALLGHLADEPEALQAVLPLLAPSRSYCPARLLLVAWDDERRMKLAESIVHRYPQSKAAPVALYLLCGRGEPWQPTRPTPTTERAQAALAQQYPESAENVAAQFIVAVEAGHLRAADRLSRELTARHEAAPPGSARKAYLRWLADQGPRYYSDADETVAEWKQRFGDLIARAKVTDAELEACADTDADADALAGLLLERLPDQQVQVMLALWDDADLEDEAEAAIAAHPDNPLTSGLRLRIGSMAHLAVIIAAGPQEPHFAEAVEAFMALESACCWTLDEALTRYGALAAQYPGSEVEVLAAAGMAAACLRRNRPEQALEIVEEAMGKLAAERPFLERLEAQRANARNQIAAKRDGTRMAAWSCATGLLTHTDFGSALSRDSARLYAVTGPWEQGRHARAVDRKTGRLVWTSAVGDVATLEAGGDRVFYATAHGSVGCLEAATGAPLWHRNLGPARVGYSFLHYRPSELVVLWDQSVLFGLHAETGEFGWRRDLTLCGSGYKSHRPPIVSVRDDLIVCWGSGPSMCGWPCDGRERLWSVPLERLLPELPAYCEDEPLPLARCGDTVALAGETVRGPVLLGLDAHSGRVRWQTALPGGMDLFMDASEAAGAPLVRLERGLAECSPHDGSVRWSLPLPQGGGYGGLAATPSFVAVAADRSILIVQRESGHVSHVVETIRSPWYLVAEEDEGALYLYVFHEQGIDAYDVDAGGP